MTSRSVPTSMRAAQFSSTKPSIAASVRLNNAIAIPALPSANGVLVQILSASLNPVDYKFAESPIMRRLAIGSLPITPGIDFVGRVSLSSCSDFKRGDLVFGRHNGPVKEGSLADFTLLRGGQGLAKVPPEFDINRLQELSCVGVAALTAYQCLKAGDFGQSRGGAIFINGASGGTGTFGIQIAKHCLDCDYVVASCSAANADIVRALGADEVIDYRSTSVEQALENWCQRTGRKFDLVIDNAGSNPNLYWQSHHYLREGVGRYVQIAGDVSIKAIFNLTKIFLWPSIFGGRKRKFEFLTVRDNRQDLETIAKWMIDGKVKAFIEEGNEFDIADTGKAFEKLQRGGVRGKITIKVNKLGTIPAVA